MVYIEKLRGNLMLKKSLLLIILILAFIPKTAYAFKMYNNNPFIVNVSVGEVCPDFTNKTTLGLACYYVFSAGIQNCFNMTLTDGNLSVRMFNNSCVGENVTIAIYPTIDGTDIPYFKVLSTTPIHSYIEYSVYNSSFLGQYQHIIYDTKGGEMRANLTLGTSKSSYVVYKAEPGSNITINIGLNFNNLQIGDGIDINLWKVASLDYDVYMPTMPTMDYLKELCNTTKQLQSSTHTVVYNGTNQTLYWWDFTALDADFVGLGLSGYNKPAICSVYLLNNTLHVRGLVSYPTSPWGGSYYYYVYTSWDISYSRLYYISKDYMYFRYLHSSSPSYYGTITWADRTKFCGSSFGQNIIPSSSHGTVYFHDFGNYTANYVYNITRNNWAEGTKFENACVDLSSIISQGSTMKFSNWLQVLSTGWIPFFTPSITCESYTYCSYYAPGKGAMYQLMPDCNTRILYNCTWLGGLCNDAGTACEYGTVGVYCKDDFTLVNVNSSGYPIWQMICHWGCNYTAKACNPDPNTQMPETYCVASRDCPSKFCSGNVLFSGAYCTEQQVCSWSNSIICQYGCNQLLGICNPKPVSEAVIQVVGTLLGFDEPSTKMFLSVIITLIVATIVTYVVSVKGGFGGGGIVFGISVIAMLIMFTYIGWIDIVLVVLLVILTGIIVAYSITKMIGG